MISITNPVRDPRKRSNKWYDYYAGYSPSFVGDILIYLKHDSSSFVMDPWNGSGTTTRISADMGISSFGFDINPVMVLVAKAHVLDFGVKESLVSLSHDIVKKAKLHNRAVYANEPLLLWLSKDAAKVFRNLEVAIQHLLINDKKYSILSTQMNFKNISNLASFFYLALFRTLRISLKKFKTSNPTWVRTPKDSKLCVAFSSESICNLFESQIKEMVDNFDDHVNPNRLKKQSTVSIDIADSSKIPLSAESIDSIITSPPYCTRIDYVVATKPELALLGFGDLEEMKLLRNQMIGTPTINRKMPELNEEWGNTCLDFLAKVTKHESKASKSYYLKTFLQYYDAMHNSLVELNRTLKIKGHCTMVVQDSFYKDVHNDLPKIITEMATLVGWKLHERLDFEKKRTLADINRKSQIYRNNVSATESVLIFQKN